MSLFRFIEALIIVCALSLSAAEAPALWETPFFRFFAPAELESTSEFYRTELEQARRRARDHWTRPLNRPVNVYLWPRTGWDALVRDQPAMRDVLAFVRDGGESLIINHEGCRRVGIERLRRTLTHEYVHVHLGQMLSLWPDEVEGPRRLPRWVEEGVAMAVAEQVRWFDSPLVTVLGPGRVMPLMDLADHFPADAEAQNRAYRQSADAIQYLISEREGLKKFVDEIVDPDTGPPLVAQLWDRQIVEGFEQRWHRTLRIGWRWLLVFTSAGFAWAVVMVLAFFAWKRRRERARRRIARWAMEAEGLIPAGLDDEEQDEAIRRLLKSD